MPQPSNPPQQPCVPTTFAEALLQLQEAHTREVRMLQQQVAALRATRTRGSGRSCICTVPTYPTLLMTPRVPLPEGEAPALATLPQPVAAPVVDDEPMLDVAHMPSLGCDVMDEEEAPLARYLLRGNSLCNRVTSADPVCCDQDYSPCMSPTRIHTNRIVSIQVPVETPPLSARSSEMACSRVSSLNSSNPGRVSAAGRVVMGLFGSDAKTLLGLCFSGWRTFTCRIRQGDIQDDDDEVEALRQDALQHWDIGPSKSASVSPSLFRQRLSSTSIPSSAHARAAGLLSSMMLRPSSSRRVLWDMIGILLVAYDTISIPLHLAFDIEESFFFTFMAIMTSVFWTMDIFVTFLTGFHVEGIVEMRLQQTAMHYLRGWFCLDAGVVALDWLFFLLSTFAIRLGASVRILRGIRALRFLRFVKVVPNLLKLLEDVQSHILRLLLQLGRSVVVIVIVNHFVACVWFATGRFNDGDTWASHAGLLDGPESPRGKITYQYFTSLHWAFCQVTPASMEVHPRNAMERGISLVVIVVGMIMFSSFISSITSTMTQLRNIEAERIKQETALHRFFEQHKISVETGKCIVDWSKVNNQRGRKLLHQEEVPMLCGLPGSLRCKLREEVFASRLTWHPLFKAFQGMADGFVRKLCDVAVSEHRMADGQELFSKGIKASSMYFVRTGTLSYSMGVVDSHEVGKRCWLSEVALWCSWVHRGTASSKGSSEVLALDVARFHEVLQRCPKSLRRFVRHYAAAFVRHECVGDCHASSSVHWLTDLCCPPDAIWDLVQDARLTAGAGMLSMQSMMSKLGSKLLS